MRKPIIFQFLTAVFASAILWMWKECDAAPSVNSTSLSILRPGLDWKNEKWTGSDKPYIVLETRLQKEFYAPGTSPSTLRQRFYQYKNSSLAQPTDAQSQYAAAFAAYAVLKLKVPGLLQDDVTAILASIRNAPSPHSYRYARMRYLLEHRVGVDSTTLYGRSAKIAGFQLLKRNPNDFLVKYLQILWLTMSVTHERELALQYSRDLIKMQPNNWRGYYALGEKYRGLWNTNNLHYISPKQTLNKHDFGTRDKAIAAYREAMKRMTNAESRQVLQGTINRMMQGQPG